MMSNRMALKYYDIHISIAEPSQQEALDKLDEVSKEILNREVGDIREHADSAICDPPIPFCYVCCQYCDYPEGQENDYIRSILKRYPEDIDIIYGGWIKAQRWHRKKLINLGITGKVKYNWKQGCFERCYATEQVMQKLIDKIPDFAPEVFTAINKDTDEVLPREFQKFWGD